MLSGVGRRGAEGPSERTAKTRMGLLLVEKVKKPRNYGLREERPRRVYEGPRSQVRSQGAIQQREAGLAGRRRRSKD
jgi:hypothetical protein